MGLLTYEYRISFARTMVYKTPVEDMIKKEVAFLMNVLPEGTEFLDSVPVADSGMHLSKCYKLTFGHPFFENGTTLEVDRKRIIWEGKDRLEQGEMFIGLRYVTPMQFPVNPMAHLDDVGAPVIQGKLGKLSGVDYDYVEGMRRIIQDRAKK